MNRAFACIVEGRDGKWEAFCLDLDLAVAGDSFEEVYHDLNEAIQMHVAYAMSLPEAERDQLLNRRMPLMLRFGFIWKMLMTFLRKGGRNHANRHEILYTCPA